MIIDNVSTKMVLMHFSTRNTMTTAIKYFCCNLCERTSHLRNNTKNTMTLLNSANALHKFTMIKEKQ